MHVLRVRWIIVVIFVSAGWSTIAPFASAQETPATPDAFVAPEFTIFPIGDYENRWFDVTLEPGTTQTLTAGIRNSGKIPVTLRTYATNAFNPPNGGFAAGTEDEEPTAATLWIDYPAETLDLGPDEGKEIDFTVSVPEGTTPGLYVVALNVQTTESLIIPGSDTLRQIIRNSVSVEITVPGEATASFELGSPSFAPESGTWALQIPFRNTGTTRLRPLGELTVSSSDGQTVATTPIEMGSVYSGNKSSVHIRLPAQLPLGNYFVSVSLTDEATGATASMTDEPVTLVEPQEEEAIPFTVDEVPVAPDDDPVRYADVAAVITNNGPDIPTANVSLTVMRDSEEVESYPLAQNQALPQGATDFSQRYIPVDGWQPGTYTFELVISAVSGDTETVLATVEIPDEIVVP